tara:strand:+ start:23 stop:688 length:666 start_codon:yes stop_codon:yes gene_type:complete
MANVKITALNHQTAFADDDLFLVVDVGEDETRKFTYANLIGTAGNVHIVNANVTAVESRRVSNVTEQTAIETRRTNNIAGAVSTITTSDLTASRALVSSGSGKVAISDITSTELGYLDGVSSAIQTQLDAKASESTRATNAAALAAGIASSPTSVSNILHTTSTANSYATGGATSDLDKVLVYLSGIYQTENQYVLGNSTHNVQFKDATLVAGLELEIRKF